LFIFRGPSNGPFIERFNTLVWSPHSKASGQGIIAGGKENGELDFYDPALLMNDKTTKDHLARHVVFSGPVKGLDFSPVTPGLFSAGGPDAEVRFKLGRCDNLV
jgi:protein transport protein SEC31